VELSAEAPYTLHILGYRINPHDVPLQTALQEIRVYRDERNETICRRLREAGCAVDLEGWRREAGGEVVARPHMARVLVRKGYVPNLLAAFARYLGRDGSPTFREGVFPLPTVCASSGRAAVSRCWPIPARPTWTTMRWTTF
jgi:predicted metal-dependent phosphoesterase TrpH